MFKNILFASIFILAVTQHSGSYGQLKQVQYDIKKDSFSNILPFDQPFEIKITNIDTGVKRVTIEVFKLAPRRGGKWDTFRVLQDCNVLEQDNGLTYPDSKVTMTQPLLPGKYYSFNLSMATQRPLSDAEQATLKAALDNSGATRRLLNTFGKRAISDSTKMLALNDMDSLLKQFNTSVNETVHKIDPHYKFNTSDTSEISALCSFLSRLYNLSDKPASIKKTIKYRIARGTPIARPDVDKGNAFADGLLQRLQQVDWAGIQQGDNATYAWVLGDTSSLKDTLRGYIRKNFDVSLALDQALIYRDELKGYPSLSDIIAEHTTRQTAVNPTFTDTLIGQARMQVTLDAGYGYAYNMDGFFGYVGANIYFRPIYKNLPLGNFRGFRDFWGIRSSLLIGMTLSSVAKDNVRKGIIDDNKTLLVGMGFRLTNWFKVNAGGLFYSSADPNPLIGTKKYSTSIDPFFSLSIDFDVKPLFAGLGDALFKTN